MDLPERLMMMVSFSSVFVNGLQHSAVSRPKGGSSSGAAFFCFGVEKSNAYKAPGAVIEGVPATWASPEIAPGERIVGHAASLQSTRS